MSEEGIIYDPAEAALLALAPSYGLQVKPTRGTILDYRALAHGDMALLRGAPQTRQEFWDEMTAFYESDFTLPPATLLTGNIVGYYLFPIVVSRPASIRILDHTFRFRFKVTGMGNIDGALIDSMQGTADINAYIQRANYLWSFEIRDFGAQARNIVEIDVQKLTEIKAAIPVFPTPDEIPPFSPVTITDTILRTDVAESTPLDLRQRIEALAQDYPTNGTVDPVEYTRAFLSALTGRT